MYTSACGDCLMCLERVNFVAGLTSSLSLEEKCIPIVPEEHARLGQLVDGFHVSLEATWMDNGLSVRQYLLRYKYLHHLFLILSIGVCVSSVCHNSDLSWTAALNWPGLVAMSWLAWRKLSWTG